jgi:hypothetical protein
MSYKNKYLKYKQKYLELKNQYGGDYNDTIIEYLSNKSNQIKPEFNNRHFFNNFNLHNLFITHDLKTIDKIYKKNKYLQLRKYNNEKKLIIGC